jgi:predicted Zn-ribbon and HTH transcriptional regulator
VEPEETEAEEAENAYVAESTREVETTVEAETVRNAETAKEADTVVNVVPASCNICDYESKTEEILKIHIGRNHQDIPQSDGETNDNVKIDCEPVEHQESKISKQCCPLCGDNTVYLKTESEFKSHILNNHEQMKVLKTFGKECNEENTRHFFFIDKDRRKIWKNFMKWRQ